MSNYKINPAKLENGAYGVIHTNYCSILIGPYASARTALNSVIKRAASIDGIPSVEFYDYKIEGIESYSNPADAIAAADYNDILVISRRNGRFIGITECEDNAQIIDPVLSIAYGVRADGTPNIGRDHAAAVIDDIPAIDVNDMMRLDLYIADGNTKTGGIRSYGCMPGTEGVALTWADGAELCPDYLPSCAAGCPFAKEGERGGCYGISECLCRPTLARLMAQNAMYEIQMGANIWARAIVSEIYKTSLTHKLFRMWEMGDFRSPDHAMEFFKYLKQIENDGTSIRVAIYTRRYDWVNAAFAAYPSKIVAVNFSANSPAHMATIPNPHEFNYFLVVNDVTEGRKYGKVCPNSLDKSVTCDKCHFCYRRNSGVICGPIHGEAKAI